MHYMVELAIEREAAILDEQLDLSDIFELPPAPWAKAEDRLHAHSRKFSGRRAAHSHAPTHISTVRPRYAN